MRTTSAIGAPSVVNLDDRPLICIVNFPSGGRIDRGIGRHDRRQAAFCRSVGPGPRTSQCQVDPFRSERRWSPCRTKPSGDLDPQTVEGGGARHTRRGHGAYGRCSTWRLCDCDGDIADARPRPEPLPAAPEQQRLPTTRTDARDGWSYLRLVGDLIAHETAHGTPCGAGRQRRTAPRTRRSPVSSARNRRSTSGGVTPSQMRSSPRRATPTTGGAARRDTRAAGAIAAILDSIRS